MMTSSLVVTIREAKGITHATLLTKATIASKVTVVTV
jgi:hypothetical protein